MTDPTVWSPESRPIPEDMTEVTDAADDVESRLPHNEPTVPFARYTFAELLTDLDKQALLEFGRNII